MDDDGCTRRRMFVLLQPLPYQVMSANSLKTKWKPEDVSGGLQDWGTRKVQLILCSCNDAGLWKVDCVSPRAESVNLSRGRERAGVRPKDVLWCSLRLHLRELSFCNSQFPSTCDEADHLYVRKKKKRKEKKRRRSWRRSSEDGR